MACDGRFEFAETMVEVGHEGSRRIRHWLVPVALSELIAAVETAKFFGDILRP
jgi:hypothetical protein